MVDEKLDGAMIDITLKPDGTYLDLRLSNSVVTPFLAPTAAPHTLPIGLIGINRWEEIRAANASVNARQDVVIFGNTVEARFGGPTFPRPKDLEPILDHYEVDPGHYLGFISRPAEKFSFHGILNGYLDSIYTIITKRRHHTRLLSSFNSYLSRLDMLCDASPIAVSLNRYSGGEQAVALSVWLSRPRKRPAFLLNLEPINCIDADFIQIPSQTMSTSSFLQEIRTKFHLSREEVDTVFRVWNLSRRRAMRGQVQPVNRSLLSVSLAQDLCSVISETYESQIREHAKPRQMPAPIKFRVGPNSIELLHDPAGGDSDVIVAASVNSLMKICDDLRSNATLHNLVPSFGQSLENICALLTLIQNKSHDDGTVVALGLEINALQWQIDGIKEQVSEFALAQATALFANSHLFMSRFPVWQNYLSSSQDGDDNDAEDFLAAKRILHAATPRESLLSQEAAIRIGSLLARGGEDKSAPALKNGVVAAAENLTAAVVNGISEIVIAHNAGKEVISQAGASALSSFAKDNMAAMTGLATMKKLPWAQWATLVLTELP